MPDRPRVSSAKADDDDRVSSQIKRNCFRNPENTGKVDLVLDRTVSITLWPDYCI